MSKKGRKKNKSVAPVAIASSARASQRPSGAPPSAKSVPSAGPQSSPPSGQPIEVSKSVPAPSSVKVASVAAAPAKTSSKNPSNSAPTSSRGADIAVEAGSLAAPNVPAELVSVTAPVAKKIKSAEVNPAYAPHDAHDEDAEAFFASAPLLPVDLSDAHDHDDLHAPRSLRHLHADVMARRAQHTKYVRIALIALGALALAGLVRWASNRHDTSAASAPMIATSASAVVPAKATHSSSPPSQPSVLAVHDPIDAGSVADAAPEAAVQGETDFSALTPAERAKASKGARNRAERALDGGKLKEAIEAAELATHADPLDGDAWLLLGAAYQQQGNANEARRCFLACTKQAKRGAIGECQQMLR